MATQLTTKKREVYADFVTSFDSNPINDDVMRVTNEDTVKRSIRNILLTRPGERFRKPNFGAGLASFLFEPISNFTASAIKESITYAINTYEPRARIYDVYVAADEDNNGYNATIMFSVHTVEKPLQLTVFLTRVR